MYKASTIEIPTNNPFEHCKLGREAYANVLTDIVRTNPDGFVLALDNKWGAGKTTFVSMWRHLLESEQNGFKTLYFNAWENDFENNPFIAITAELKELLKNESSKTFKEVVKKGNEIAKAAIPSIIKTFIKRHGGEDLAEIIEKTSEGVFEAFQEDIDSYIRRKQSNRDFHNELQKYIKENSNDKPIVFIIDELDRCRPDYAVSVLENVKHLFSVKGIVFVLSIDKEQLGHAICGVYGSEYIDSNEYLRRFIDIEYSLPKPSLKKYINYLTELYKLNEFFKLPERTSIPELSRDTRYFNEHIEFLFELRNPTLRQQEKIFQHTGIVLRSFAGRAFIIPELLVFLIYLKLFHKDFYFQIRNKELDHQELLDKCSEILKGVLTDVIKNRLRINIEAMLLNYYNEYLDDSNERTALRNYTNDSELKIKSHFDPSTDQKDFKYYITQDLNSYHRSRISIVYLLDKIDLLDPLIDV